MNGIAAALLAPAAMTAGFYVWEKQWKGSAYALNLYKCSFGGAIFLVFTFFTVQNTSQITFSDISALFVSSIIGIIIGDNAWILSLQMIGSRRVIIVDLIKPFLASILGTLILDEPLTSSMVIGLFMSVFGMFLVCFDADPSEESATSSSNRRYAVGYLLAAINVSLDAYGSVLTKQHGVLMNTWEINAFRFCFAATVMAVLSVLLCSLEECSGLKAFQKTYFSASDSYAGLELTDKPAEEGFEVLDSELGAAPPPPTDKWYLLPLSNPSMGVGDWIKVSGGCLFVTVACPALANYALFRLHVGTCLTLTSMGPVYALPIGWFVKGESVSVRSIVGSVIAVAGVAVMCLT